MTAELIDKANVVIRRLRLVQMAAADISDAEQADALQEGVYLTEVALDELKALIMAARSADCSAV